MSHRPKDTPLVHFALRRRGVLPTSLARTAIVCGLIATVFVAAVSTRAAAEEIKLGSVLGSVTKAGFTMDLYAPRLSQEGYRPLRLSFRSAGQGFQRERNLVVQLRPISTYTTDIDYVYEFPVRLPEGKKQFDQEVLVPQYYRWEQCRVRLIEGGRRIGKNDSIMQMTTAVQDQGQSMSLGILLSGGSGSGSASATADLFPDLRSFVTVFGDDQIQQTMKEPRLDSRRARTMATTLTTGTVRCRILDASRASSDWLAYSQLDVLLVPYALVERMEQTQPLAVEAILRWVSSGGQLWTYGSSRQTNPAGTSLIEELCQLDPNDPANLTIQAITPKRLPDVMKLGESNRASTLRYQPYNGSFYQDSFQNGTLRRRVFDKLVKSKHPVADMVSVKELRDAFGYRRYGMGGVLRLAAEDPFPGSYQLWYSIRTTTLPRSWSERQGADFANGNESCWWWMMATVGRPPVTAFMVSNALFGIVMGPLLYFWLRRRKRLFLLFFLAPVLGLMTTLGLFGYAFFSDGLSTRARVRQLSWYDGLSIRGDGQAPMMDQTRHTYYTVLGEKDGLRFNRDTMVLPVSWNGIHGNFRANSSNEPIRSIIRQRESAQQFSGSFLKTRTQSQFLTVRPSLAKPPITIQAAGDGKTVTNQLDHPIRQLAFRDDGSFWIAESVGVGETVPLEQRQGKPNSFQAFSQDILQPKPSGYIDRMQSAPQLSDLTDVESRFASWLQRTMPGDFLIVTEVDESDFALPDCRREDCVRLIGGKLK
ncbi:MAG: hypothetical protein AAFV88_06025 [Planctomycetota bacterium]